MAKQRPPLELGDLTENLKESKGQGMGVFFPSPLPRPKDVGAERQTTTIRRQAGPAQAKTKTVLKPPEEQSQASVEDIGIDATTSSRQDVDLREWRDLIENTETHNSSLRLTRAELYEVEDLKTELERKLKIGSSLNEMARLGLLYIIHDFKKNREDSLIVKVKKS